MAFLAGEDELITAGPFGSGGVEVVDALKVVLEEGGNGVFDVDLVDASESNGFDALGETGKPAVEIKMVGRLVHDDAAAFAVPCTAPAAAIVVRLSAVPTGSDEADVVELAKVTAFDHLVGENMGRDGALLEVDAEHDAGFLAGGDHAVGRGKGVSNGLFAEDVDAALGGGEGRVFVLGVRGGDDEKLRSGGVEHGFDGGEGRDIERPGCFLGELDDDVGQADELDEPFLLELEGIFDVCAAYDADAGDGDAGWLTHYATSLP